MKTKTECLQLAARCERMAADAGDKAGRIALLATAAHWRSLANHAPDGNDKTSARPAYTVRNALQSRDVEGRKRSCCATEVFDVEKTASPAGQPYAEGPRRRSKGEGTGYQAGKGTA